METTITATELAKSLTEILKRIRDGQERFVIQQHGKPIATLAPVSSSSPITLRELALLLATLPRPDSAFADDLEAIQSAQRPVSIPE